MPASKLLTRAEEFVLLAVWRLQGEAYSLPIRKRIIDVTGYNWSLGSVYTPLERLTRKGLLTSYLTTAKPERGGRHKRVYQLTPMGRAQLIRVRDVEVEMWSGISGLNLAGVVA